MKKLAIILFCGIALFACKKDEPTPTTNYGSGLIILNEGPFGTGTGTISFWDRDTKKTVNDVFGLENQDAKVGNVLQSMVQVGDDYYFIVNNANKIVITDKNFKYKSEIKNLRLPRYGVVNNGKLYVSQWGNDGISGSLVVIDLALNTILKEIPLGKGPENMLILEDKLYVSLVGGYDRDNRVIVLDLKSEQILTTIQVADNPAQMISYNYGIMLLCKGFQDYANPTNSTTGKLVKIEKDSIVFTEDINDFADNLTLDYVYENFYFTINGKPAIYHPLTQNIQIYNYNSNIYKMGFDYQSESFWITDAGDFTGAGKVYITDKLFKIQDSISVGIIPTAIYER